MIECMDECMSKWTEEWTSRWVDEWMAERVDGWIYVCMAAHQTGRRTK